MFPPITGKLQKIKIDEKLTIFENFDQKKVPKPPLLSIFWHLGNQISTPVQSNISLVGNRSKKIGKMNKNLSFTDGLSPSVLGSQNFVVDVLYRALNYNWIEICVKFQPYSDTLEDVIVIHILTTCKMHTFPLPDLLNCDVSHVHA